MRPDRADLLTARLNLEERLLRFDEAAASAQKLYDLTYRNPRWMEKVAGITSAAESNRGSGGRVESSLHRRAAGSC